MVATADSIRVIPLFRGSSDRTIEIISGIVREKSFPAGATLTREGETGEFADHPAERICDRRAGGPDDPPTRDR